MEITSRFAGVIKKLHYEAGEMAKVGKPLVDIDIQGEIKPEDLDALAETSAGEETALRRIDRPSTVPSDDLSPAISSSNLKNSINSKGKHATLATPAVRHLTKELDVDIVEVDGTGKDGRVLKHDVYQFAKQRDTTFAFSNTVSSFPMIDTGVQKETSTQLSSMQAQMFRTMTRSLNIPHFLYADEIDFSRLSELRQRLNRTLVRDPVKDISKLSFLPFIIKGISLMLQRYPALNARVDVDPNSPKPTLILRSQHNIGVAMDAPSGLLVPVIKKCIKPQSSVHRF